MKNAGFTVFAASALALGIGPVISIFALANSVLIRQPPFHRPDRLVQILERRPGMGGFRRISLRSFLRIQGQARSFQHVAAFGVSEMVLVGSELTEKVTVMRVTDQLFPVLKASAFAGRLLTEQDFEPESSLPVVLSHDFWMHRFGGSRAVIGANINLIDLSIPESPEEPSSARRTFVVIGVMPPGFGLDRMTPIGPSRGPNRLSNFRKVQLWLPMHVRIKPRSEKRRPVIARLLDDEAIKAAQVELDSFSNSWDGLGRELPCFQILTLRSSLTSESERSLLLVFTVAVSFVLAICIVNVSILFLAHFDRRTREFGVLAAVGADKMHLANLIFCQGLLLSTLGGVAGLCISHWGIHAIVNLGQYVFFRLPDGITTEKSVLLFSSALSLLAGMACSAAPAIRIFKADLRGTLNQGQSVTLQKPGWVSRAFIVGEVSLTFILLAGTGLLVNSFVRIQLVHPGFKAEGVLTFEIPSEYMPMRRTGFNLRQRRLAGILSQIQAVPGVEGAAVGSVPLRGLLSTYVSSEGRQERVLTMVNAISAQFHEVLGIHLLRGRSFFQSDSDSAPRVVILNDRIAEKLWPSQDPLGKRISFSASSSEILTVVGVVPAIRRRGLDVVPANEIYLPFLQSRRFSDEFFLVKSRLEPGMLVPAIRRAVRDFDKTLPLARVSTLEDLLAESVLPRWFNMWLIGVLASLALTLASTGLFGLISTQVSHRIHEIGIRMALGATRADILRMNLRMGGSLISSGLLLGVCGVLASGRFIAPFLFGVEASDPVTLFAASSFLMGTGMLAVYIPAARAANVAPSVALKYE